MNNREAFEVWAEKELLPLDRRDSDHYRYNLTNRAWLGWQAALTSQAQQDHIGDTNEVACSKMEMTTKEQHPYDSYLGSVLIALENAISDLKGIIYTDNLKPYVEAKNKLASYIQSQAQQTESKAVRLQVALEGECNGLAVDLQTAQRILDYVSLPPAPEGDK